MGLYRHQPVKKNKEYLFKKSSSNFTYIGAGTCKIYIGGGFWLKSKSENQIFPLNILLTKHLKSPGAEGTAGLFSNYVPVPLNTYVIWESIKS